MATMVWVRALAVVGAISSFAVMDGALALEGGQSPYLKGFRDFSSGVEPGPGVLVRNDVYVYSGKERSTIPQGKVAAGLHLYLNALSVTAITPYQILGGNYAFAVRGAVTHVYADRSLTTVRGTGTVSNRLTAFSDMVVNPLILGWHAGNFHWNFVTTLWLPTGNYDSTRVVNTGKNAWAWSPQIAGTYLDPETGWDLSAALAIVYSSENTTTHYRSGDVLHIDAAAGKRVAPGITLGVAGYIMEQLTGDSGAGATFGDRKASVLGVGPAARFTVKGGEHPVVLVAKYYREFSAHNTTQGDTGMLSMRIKF